MSIFNFFNLPIHEIQQLACQLINQLHSDDQAAQIEEGCETCFFVMRPLYRNMAKQKQKKRQMEDIIK